MRIVVLVAIGLVALGMVASAQISGTAHDLTNIGGIGTNQVCQPCHTPHNAQGLGGASGKGSVLWNKAASTETYTLYDPAYGALTGQASLACLSCHDGVTAIDNYGGRTPVIGGMTGQNMVGTDLSNDHPVGFDYNTYGPGVKPTEYQATPNAPLVLFSGNVECGTCHNVHDDSLSPFLRVTSSNSDICLDCHIK